MELVKKLKGFYDHNGVYRSMGLFYCPLCGKNVKRSYSAKKNSSCGCNRKKRGGYSNSRIYHVWVDMIHRCKNKKNINYKRYGARGIDVCKNWEDSFLLFRDWAFLNGYNDNLQIDRINNNGNYEPSNCRFVTHKVNNRNKRDVILTIEKAILIRKLYKTGLYKQASLARVFKVRPSSIWGIVHNKNWIE